MAKGFHDLRYKKLIGLLVERRRALGYSQAELAARLRTHQQFVSRYETGERRLDVVEFCDIAEALGLAAPAMLSGIAVGPLVFG